jgi:hypothetical protein
LPEVRNSIDRRVEAVEIEHDLHRYRDSLRVMGRIIRRRASGSPASKPSEQRASQ